MLESCDQDQEEMNGMWEGMIECGECDEGIGGL